MTETQVRQPYKIEGPVRHQRFGSVGFRLADPLAPQSCRYATRKLLTTFGLDGKFPHLVSDCMVMVSELVTNACEHASKGSPFPAGSLTIWHPNRWLIITVHDKSPYVPYRETYRGVPNPGDIPFGVAEREPNADAFEEMRQSGRGLQLVRALAADHCGELDWARDDDPQTPGKVARVKMLLPNVMWPHTFTDPWTGRVVVGNSR
ncbi:hypothetical protein HOS59_gp57 [Streptomyces phage Rowa]|uniref:Histidine kinase/HSP90-like ATPase domain-containing protein n=1 Tax=Streptomyces phage Rowa TaxID=2059883 RepID=A0A2H5BM12_9CAUD|nr:hypothetical protein HOS59_gp57 [Streptomyces phage Rowa]AUG87321.1 hypothetical protein SEA_ROWA_57 [Streptomyces phage Rowa]